MKTTLEISDRLLRDARTIAKREGATLSALVERGLRHVIAQKGEPRTAFRLRKASFRGRGVRSELQEAGWDRLRALVYGGREVRAICGPLRSGRRA